MDKKEVCEICQQGIKNPVCNTCRLREFEYWIKVSSIDKNVRDKIIKEIKRKLLSEEFNVGNDSDEKCVICGDEYISICSYCFFFEILNILEKYNISRQDLDSFLETFNYRFFEDEHEDMDDFEDIHQEKYLKPYLNHFKN